MNEITDWINNLLLHVEPPEGIYNLNNFNKCVATKSFQEIYSSFGSTCKMTINGCDESNIYIDSNV